MIKTVLVDNLTKEDALIYEDNIIRALQMNDLCINTKRSDLIAKYKNVYMKQYYQDNTEQREHKKQRARQRYQKKKLEKQQQNSLP